MNYRIKGIKLLIPHQFLVEDTPLTLKAAEGKKAAENAIKGANDRLLVVVSPCFIYDVQAAKKYATRLIGKVYLPLFKLKIMTPVTLYFEVLNFDSKSIHETAQELQKVKLTPVVMVDCSHDNYNRQPIDAQSIVRQTQIFKNY